MQPDNDLSRMLTAVLVARKHPTAVSRYRLVSRIGSNLLNGASNAIISAIEIAADNVVSSVAVEHWRAASATLDDIAVIQGCLRDVSVTVDTSTGLDVEVKGPWCAAAIFTTPILAAIHETLTLRAYRPTGIAARMDGVLARLAQLDTVDPDRRVLITELGTRRRMSVESQVRIVETAVRRWPGRIAGTGNPRIARLVGIPTAGMMHHDYILGSYGLQNDSTIAAENRAMLDWLETFEPHHQGFLTDTFGLAHFMSAMGDDGLARSNRFRHDSGDPIVWSRSLAERLERVIPDPADRQFIFTDSLSIDELPRLYDAVRHLCTPRFGVGGGLVRADDNFPVSGSIKLVEINGNPVEKRSDDSRKNLPKMKPLDPGSHVYELTVV